MTTEARFFFPGVCPGCGEPVQAVYSQYARSRAHPLYVPLMAVLFVVAVALVAVSFWAVAQVTDALLAGRGLQRKERGLVYFIASSMVSSAAVWGCVWLARLLGRLPRTFEYECGVCRWVGPAGVVVGALPADAGLTARVAAVDADGPFAAMRDRRDQHHLAHARDAEQNAAPNPDFDFGTGDRPG